MNGPEAAAFPRSVVQNGKRRRVSQTYRLLSTCVSLLDEITIAHGLKNRREALEFCIEFTRKNTRVEAHGIEVPTRVGPVKLAGWNIPRGIALAAEGGGVTRIGPEQKKMRLLAILEAAGHVFEERRDSRPARAGRKKRP